MKISIYILFNIFYIYIYYQHQSILVKVLLKLSLGFSGLAFSHCTSSVLQAGNCHRLSFESCDSPCIPVTDRTATRLQAGLSRRIYITTFLAQGDSFLSAGNANAARRRRGASRQREKPDPTAVEPPKARAATQVLVVVVVIVVNPHVLYGRCATGPAIFEARKKKERP